MNCIFCKIIAGEIPSTKVYEDEDVLAFRDIQPQAPTHILVIPKLHIAGLSEVTSENSHVVAKMSEAVAKIATDPANGIEDFRMISNNGVGAGQTVNHLHFHLLGGKSMNDKLI